MHCNRDRLRTLLSPFHTAKTHNCPPGMRQSRGSNEIASQSTSSDTRDALSQTYSICIVRPRFRGCGPSIIARTPLRPGLRAAIVTDA